jgi:hypothetical protein
MDIHEMKRLAWVIDVKKKKGVVGFQVEYEKEEKGDDTDVTIEPPKEPEEPWR